MHARTLVAGMLRFCPAWALHLHKRGDNTVHKSLAIRHALQHHLEVLGIRVPVPHLGIVVAVLAILSVVVVILHLVIVVAGLRSKLLVLVGGEVVLPIPEVFSCVKIKLCPKLKSDSP